MNVPKNTSLSSINQFDKCSIFPRFTKLSWVWKTDGPDGLPASFACRFTFQGLLPNESQHLQSELCTNRHPTLSKGNMSWQCKTQFGSRHRSADPSLLDAISFYRRHNGQMLQYRNDSAQTTIVEQVEDRLLDCGDSHCVGVDHCSQHPNVPPTTFCQLVISVTTLASRMSDVVVRLKISEWAGQLSWARIVSISLSSFIRRAGGSVLVKTGSQGSGVGQNVQEIRHIVCRPS